MSSAAGVRSFVPPSLSILLSLWLSTGISLKGTTELGFPGDKAGAHTGTSCLPALRLTGWVSISHPHPEEHKAIVPTAKDQGPHFCARGLASSCAPGTCLCRQEIQSRSPCQPGVLKIHPHKNWSSVICTLGLWAPVMKSG